MKSTLLILLLVVFSFSGKCQNYQSICGQDSTIWTVLEEIIDGAMTAKYQTKNGVDSILNGYTYKKVFNNYQTRGLLREDTVDGKAWYYSFFTQTENIFMDLSLQLNDTFMIYSPWVSNIPIVVDSVYFINGLKHIRFDFNLFGYVRKFEFIEGLGTNAGIAYQGQTQGWNYISEYLLCKYTDSTKVYENIDYNGMCYVQLVGINEYLNESSTVAFPNPVKRNELLTIRNDMDPVQSIRLRDIFGNSICRLESFQIKMNQAAGIYIIEIVRKSGKRENLKICITD